MLNSLSEVRTKPESLNPIQENGGWEEIEVIVDSGASSTVLPPTFGRQYDVQESAGSKAGVCYEIANGQHLPNLGEKRLAVMTEEGTVSCFTGQVADVSKCLMSVRAMCKNNHTVVFDGEGSYSLNKTTGECNWFHDDGVNYIMKQWIIPPDKIGEVMMASGFPRRA